MYYMLECLDPADGFQARLSYKRDTPLRSWTRGQAFAPPPTPVIATLDMQTDSKLIEMWSWPLPVMTKRLHQALLKAGVGNLDVYPAELHDPKSGAVYSDYVAFNIVGTVAAADMEKSEFSAPDGPMISVDFDSLAIDEKKTRGALMFRLAESTNGIVVHERVKAVIEAEGIDTLTFIKPEEWFG